jgi:hypothetical protein
MYKSFKVGKYSFVFNKFPKTRKQISKVYHTGFRKFDLFECVNYSIVLGRYRFIFAIDKMQGSCSNSN